MAQRNAEVNEGKEPPAQSGDLSKKAQTKSRKILILIRLHDPFAV